MHIKYLFNIYTPVSFLFLDFCIVKLIVRDARSVVLAGGTMEPMSEFIDQLFLMAGAMPDRIMTFSCDHVIPKENIISNVVIRGPTGIEFEFNFHNRQDTKLVIKFFLYLIFRKINLKNIYTYACFDR